jgi:radical SAM protein with 4Fe4S-binding SPASM domain
VDKTKSVSEFYLESSVNLPKDTVIIIPKPLNGTIFEQNRDILNKRMFASNSKARYIVLDKSLLPGMVALIKRKSVEFGINSLEAAGYSDPLAGMTEILFNIAARDFYENAEAEKRLISYSNLHLYVTNKCNLRCGHCYMRSGRELKNGEMSLFNKKRSLEIFAKIYPKGHVTFSGGEPLTSPDFPAILQCATDLGLKSTLFTNGLLLNRANVKSIIPFLDKIQISLDGTSAYSNDFIRGKGTFKEILNSIIIADHSIYESGSQCELNIAITLTSNNSRDIFDNLPKLIHQLELKSSHRYLLSELSEAGRASKSRSIINPIENKDPSYSDIIKQMSEIGIYDAPTYDKYYSTNCGIGESVTISSDGQIFPCSIIEQPSIGNIVENSSEDYIKSVKEYSESLSVENIDVCKKCDIRYFCLGSCRIKNYRHKKSYKITACTEEFKNGKIHKLINTYLDFRHTHY